MATISQMIGVGNYSFYNYSGSNNRTSNSIANLWNNYNSITTGANSMMNALSGLSEIRSGVRSLVASYDTARDTFNAEFDESMSDLRSSAAKIRNYDFSVGEDAITTKEVVDDKGNASKETVYSDAMKGALQTIKDFINDYNGAHKFLSDNKEVSSRVARMATTFGDTTYRASLYESIGINVGSDGTLSIDESKLADTIANDPNKVSRILGKDGLAGKAESHVSIATSQRDRLFPSAQTMIGDDLASASLYTGGAYAKMMSVASVGNLLNMMF